MNTNRNDQHEREQHVAERLAEQQRGDDDQRDAPADDPGDEPAAC